MAGTTATATGLLGTRTREPLLQLSLCTPVPTSRFGLCDFSLGTLEKKKRGKLTTNFLILQIAIFPNLPVTV